MIVDNIRRLCERQGITLAELERTLSLGNGTVAKWDKSSPGILRVKAVADFFNVTIDSLLREESA